MIAVWIVGGALVASLAVVMALGGVFGLLGILGAVRVVRCDRCGRFGLTSLGTPLRSCVRCRHGVLLHPVATRHFLHAARHGGARHS